MHIFLETKRLILRRFTIDDISNLVELDGDPEVMRYVSGGANTPRNLLRNDHLPYYLDCYSKSPGYGFWAVVEKETGDFLGGFHLRPHTASRRVMKKCGMRLVRTFKPTPEELFEYLGVTVPSIFSCEDVEYAITKSEWEQQDSWTT